MGKAESLAKIPGGHVNDRAVAVKFPDLHSLLASPMKPTLSGGRRWGDCQRESRSARMATRRSSSRAAMTVGAASPTGTMKLGSIAFFS
jgi:hypothetical protein